MSLTPLLRTNSDARGLFTGDIERQRMKLMEVIAALVGSLDERQSLVKKALVAITPNSAFCHGNMSQ